MQEFKSFFTDFLKRKNVLIRFRRLVKDETKYTTLHKYLENTNVGEWVTKVAKARKEPTEKMDNILNKLDKEWQKLWF